MKQKSEPYSLEKSDSINTPLRSHPNWFRLNLWPGPLPTDQQRVLPKARL